MSQKFFCDNCGTQVDKNEVRCTGCGRYFRSVKCPSCGHTGNPDEFSDGCPVCGYAAEIPFEFEDSRNGKKWGRADSSSWPSAKVNGAGGSMLSGRFYRAAIPVLLIILAGLLIWFFLLPAR